MPTAFNSQSCSGEEKESYCTVGCWFARRGRGAARHSRSPPAGVRLCLTLKHSNHWKPRDLSPCSRVLTVRPVLTLAPLQLSHHSPSHADLHFPAADSDSLAAGFVLSFFFSILLPTILPPPRLATGTPPTLLPPPSCASRSVPSFFCVSHISIAGLGFVFEHGVIGKFDFAWQRTDCIMQKDRVERVALPLEILVKHACVPL